MSCPEVRFLIDSNSSTATNTLSHTIYTVYNYEIALSPENFSFFFCHNMRQLRSFIPGIALKLLDQPLVAACAKLDPHISSQN